MQLKLELEREVCRPLEKLRGRANWVMDAAADLELRLFWYTEGKGTRDVGVIATERFPAGVGSGSRPFEFPLPDAPYTLHGKLISIRWAVELLKSGDKQAELQHFVLSPWDKPVETSPSPSTLPPRK